MLFIDVDMIDSLYIIYYIKKDISGNTPGYTW